VAGDGWEGEAEGEVHRHDSSGRPSGER
jgi:hypothetical protein